MKMTLFMMLKQLANTRLKFSLIVIFHVVFYGLTYLHADPFGPIIIFSAAWTIGYLFAMRRFITNPVDDFAAKHISYAQPNVYWINFAGRFIKNNICFLFISSIHLVMALVPIFSNKNFLYRPFIIAAIFISNAVLPITYLYVLKKLYLLWTQENNE